MKVGSGEWGLDGITLAAATAEAERIQRWKMPSVNIPDFQPRDGLR